MAGYETSRNENILQSIIDDAEYKDVPQSRIETLLLELKEVIEASGGTLTAEDDGNGNITLKLGGD